MSKKMAGYAEIYKTSLLDVGCGIGGAARMLREEYGCEVTGIDICEEYVEVAKGLAKLVGIKSGLQFIVGNATMLPFSDASFDVVWTQHVQMNVEDKNLFYQEISRVLREGGYFIYYEILKADRDEIQFPVPWASHSGHSFLMSKEKLQVLLARHHLVIEHVSDETAEGISFFQRLIEKVQNKGLPSLGLHLLMGENAGTKIGNLLHGLLNGTIELESGVCRKIT